MLIHGADKAIEPGEDPQIHGRERFPMQGVGHGVEAVDLGIEHVKCIGVPEGAHEFALGLGNGLRREAAGQPGHGAGVEIPAYGVGALIIEDRPGVYHIALVLTHLEAVLILHQAEDEAILEARLVEQTGGDGQQGIEPAAGLIHGLADEVGRVAPLEQLFIFKRIVPLGKGHGAAVEPAVDHRALALHLAAAFGAGEGNGIEERLVQLDIRRGGRRKLAKLLAAAHHMDVAAILTEPNGQGRTPIALAADAPIDYVLEEVAHTAFLDGFGDPVDAAVILDEPVLDGGHLDEPALPGVVDQRRVAAPAEGIAMLELRRGEKLARFF